MVRRREKDLLHRLKTRLGVLRWRCSVSFCTCLAHTQRKNVFRNAIKRRRMPGLLALLARWPAKLGSEFYCLFDV